MSLEAYFTQLLERVESTDDVQNNGKNKDGFYLPTRTLLLRHLNLLKDLHAKPGAKAMLRDAWQFVVEHLPPEWLILNEKQKAEIKKMLS
ncbi:MAG: hypothetical protein KF799_07345 [Bdellovibrionales bacterium]|nr:hypothetical protein [Bdellovibrionales bacterium]